MHSRLWNALGCSRSCVQMIYSDLSMLKIIPQFSHFASTLFSFRMDDTILETYSITSVCLIIKSGKASMHCTNFMVFWIQVSSLLSTILSDPGLESDQYSCFSCSKINPNRAPIPHFPLRKTPQNAPILPSSGNRISGVCLIK
jgi:hypothetical protein